MNIVYFIQTDTVTLTEEVVNKGDAFFDLKTIALFVLILILITSNILLLQRLRKSDSRLKRLSCKDDYSGFNKIQQSKDKAKIEKLEEKIAKLEEQLTNKNEKLNLSKPVKKENNVQKAEKRLIVDETPIVYDSFKIEKPQVLFLPSPFEDSKFSIEDVNEEKTPSSLYQIKLNPSKVSGELTLIDDADLTRALNSPDHYLEKACVYDNAYSIKAKSVVVIENGQVRLDNQDWSVIKKIRIKFI